MDTRDSSVLCKMQRSFDLCSLALGFCEASACGEN